MSAPRCPFAHDRATPSPRGITVVTGASGHVGVNLVRALRDAGRPVRAVIPGPTRALDGLDVEVAYVPRRGTRATRVYRLPAGRRAARRARHGSAQRVTLIRDDTGSVIVGRARWLPEDGGRSLHGEAVVDDTVLFDGDVAGVCIEPTQDVPGLRARIRGGRWVAGRAAQLGSAGVRVERDGVFASRAARRSTFYRHVEGWLAVR